MNSFALSTRFEIRSSSFGFAAIGTETSVIRVHRNNRQWIIDTDRLHSRS